MCDKGEFDDKNVLNFSTNLIITHITGAIGFYTHISTRSTLIPQVSVASSKETYIENVISDFIKRYSLHN